MAAPARGPTFAERFAYAHWLYYGRTGVVPSQTALAERVGRKQASVSEWYVREKPPVDYQTHAPMADYLGVDQDWLVRGSGEAPEPTLWAWWQAQRSRHHESSHPKAPNLPLHSRPRAAAKKGRARGA